jgi:uncharacterized membrane protein
MRDNRRTDDSSAPAQWAAVSARARLGVMVVAGIGAALVVGMVFRQWDYAPLAAWDAAALVFTVWVWAAMIPMGSSATAQHATREDPGHAQTDLIVVIAAVANLASVGYVLVQASSAKGATQDVLAGLGVLSIALSWFAVHTLYTLRYARLYYTGADGGIGFNQTTPPPRYLDFAYVSFTIGMTFQVSDTDLQTPAIRATALRQALLAYLFGAVTLAATINLVSQLATSH